jgi:hypothetical protein
MDGVILKKTTAQVRHKDGNWSAKNGASGEKIVVLLLGFKSNHPFGIFAPGFKEIGDYFRRMSVELSEGAADNGCTWLPPLPLPLNPRQQGLFEFKFSSHQPTQAAAAQSIPCYIFAMIN